MDLKSFLFSQPFLLHLLIKTACLESTAPATIRLPYLCVCVCLCVSVCVRLCGCGCVCGSPSLGGIYKSEHGVSHYSGRVPHIYHFAS